VRDGSLKFPASSLQTPVPLCFLFVSVATIIGGLLSACGSTSASSASGTGPLHVVAAETFYGSVLQQIGGSRVSVVSLLDNPNTDPHQFEASAQTGQELGDASLVIKNGIGYDAWIDKLLGASPRSGRLVISVGEMLGHHSGDNPHVWYDPNGWTATAMAIAADLGKLDPKHRAYFKGQETKYLRALVPLREEIAHIRGKAQGLAVTATEPVFDDMAAALGLKMGNLDFQKSVMDGTDPAPQAVHDIESDLKLRKVRLLLYNDQTSEPITRDVRQLAQQNHVPVVGVAELAPRALTFQAWQMRQLKEVAKALV
jgi:zinc/manganese transport system substrate-binding protein